MSLVNKYFLDFPGLAEYDRLIKEYIKTGSTDEIEKILDELVKIAEKDKAQDENLEVLNKAVEILNGDKDVEGSVDQKINSAVADLINGAPEALDTLKEIADWIADDETGTTALVNRVTKNEEDIEALQEADVELKNYIDEQDKAYFDAIVSIEDLQIASLFPVNQIEGQSVAETLASLPEGRAVKLNPNQIVFDNLTVSKDCYIDANGATFTGTVTIPKDSNVIIENATFSNPVVVA